MRLHNGMRAHTASLNRVIDKAQAVTDVHHSAFLGLRESDNVGQGEIMEERTSREGMSGQAAQIYR